MQLWEAYRKMADAGFRIGSTLPSGGSTKIASSIIHRVAMVGRTGIKLAGSVSFFLL
jgi:hypothetical protein